MLYLCGYSGRLLEMENGIAQKNELKQTMGLLK